MNREILSDQPVEINADNPFAAIPRANETRANVFGIWDKEEETVRYFAYDREADHYIELTKDEAYEGVEHGKESIL